MLLYIFTCYEVNTFGKYLITNHSLITLDKTIKRKIIVNVYASVNYLFSDAEGEPRTKMLLTSVLYESLTE